MGLGNAGTGRGRRWGWGLLVALVLGIGFAPQVARAQALTQTRPEAVGLASERLARLGRQLDDYAANKQLAGGVALVARKGQVAYVKAFGQRDLEAGDPMREDSIFRIASQTKGIVSVAAMILQEQGKLLITDPVGKYIPEFQETTVAVAKDPARTFQVLHVTGPRYEEEVRVKYGSLPEGVVLRGYEDRMADAFAVADLMLCRSGSSTLAEICAVGRASVLIPSPNVTDNHQEENARGLERAGAALVIVEKDLDMDRALGQIRDLMGDAGKRTAMADAARGLAKPDVAAEVAQLLEEKLG